MSDFTRDPIYRLRRTVRLDVSGRIAEVIGARLSWAHDSPRVLVNIRSAAGRSLSTNEMTVEQARALATTLNEAADAATASSWSGGTTS